MTRRESRAWRDLHGTDGGEVHLDTKPGLAAALARVEAALKDRAKREGQAAAVAERMAT